MFVPLRIILSEHIPACFLLPCGVLLRTMRNHIASWQVARLYESQDQMTFSCSVTMMPTMSYLVLSNITGGCKVR